MMQLGEQFDDCILGVVGGELCYSYNMIINKLMKHKTYEESLEYFKTLKGCFIEVMNPRQAKEKVMQRQVTSNPHPGFAAIADAISKKEGVSKESAGAILASQTRKASPQAKAKNPNLKKVKGK